MLSVFNSRDTYCRKYTLLSRWGTTKKEPTLVYTNVRSFRLSRRKPLSRRWGAEYNDWASTCRMCLAANHCSTFLFCAWGRVARVNVPILSSYFLLMFWCKVLINHFIFDIGLHSRKSQSRKRKFYLKAWVKPGNDGWRSNSIKLGWTKTLLFPL
jgi:hypothetical protein